ncbi:MAG: phosphoribosyl-ATP diphosphatase [Proteobacteria bacterium]|nr:phosphoribosyl-ATP diphosphatase [Pseudomonadota bacterium]NCA28015.1 phosphoribosyl-ATP diphosphatase [Pseudomonadota bacterium]
MNNNQALTAIKNSVGIEELYQIIKSKASSNDLHSYSKKLIDSKINLVAQKIGEEGVEVAISALDHDRYQNSETRHEIINEVADLFYHTLAMLVKFDIKIDEIYSELHKRNSQHDKH